MRRASSALAKSTSAMMVQALSPSASARMRPPGIDDQGVAVAGAVSRVKAELRRREHETAGLDRPGAL